MKHKNDMWIRAYLDGKPVQYKHKNYDKSECRLVTSLDVFDWENTEFIIQEPKEVEMTCEAYLKSDGSTVLLSRENTHPNLALKFDGYGKLIEARILPETIYD